MQTAEPNKISLHVVVALSGEYQQSQKHLSKHHDILKNAREITEMCDPVIILQLLK